MTEPTVTRPRRVERSELVAETTRLLDDGWRLALVATNAPVMAERGARPLLDILTCIRHRTTVDAAGRLLASNSEQVLRPGAEMEALFADVPAAVAITGELALRLGFITCLLIGRLLQSEGNARGLGLVAQAVLFGVARALHLQVGLTAGLRAATSTRTPHRQRSAAARRRAAARPIPGPRPPPAPTARERHRRR